MSDFSKFSDGDTRVDTNLVSTKLAEIVDETECLNTVSVLFLRKSSKIQLK